MKGIAPVLARQASGVAVKIVLMIVRTVLIQVSLLLYRVVRYCVKIETSGCSKRGQDTCMNHHEPPNILAQADGDGGRVVDASSCDLLACGICDRSLGVGMWTPVLLKLWHMTSF